MKASGLCERGEALLISVEKLSCSRRIETAQKKSMYHSKQSDIDIDLWHLKTLT